MIKVEVRQHDKFSIEFKSGVSITKESPEHVSQFKINTWIFVPNSLDINRSTYTKDQFYKDVKTNIRLITPIYSLDDILTEGRGPLTRLEKSINILLEQSINPENIENYSYQVKMLMCILNSTLRNAAIAICKEDVATKKEALVIDFIKNIRLIASKYRSYRTLLEKDKAIEDACGELFLFGDEYLGNIIEKHAYTILKDAKPTKSYAKVKPLLVCLIESETEHKKERGFIILDPKAERNNRFVVMQRNILKKCMESDLFLQIVKKKDGAFVEQIYYGIAAGVAMIFATVVSFVATQRYGNFTMDLFVILVVSYIFKDRIKDVMRYYFTSNMSKKYFDTKLKLSIRKQEIGHVKESFDFIEEDKLPEEIHGLRNRTPLVEAENKVYGEKIIMYRKIIELSKGDLEKYKEYRLSGINDITRFGLLSYLQKMDNPAIPLNVLNEESDPEIIKGEKVYSLYFVLDCISENNHSMRAYRILFNRAGIAEIKELN